MCSAATENRGFPRLPEPAPHILIIGSGYLGRVVAERYLKRGVQVTATTRSGDLPAGLSPRVRAQALDLGDPAAILALARALGPQPLDTVQVLVPPGPDPERVLIEAPARLLDLLAIAGARRIVVASSTAVYGDLDGAWVSADSEAVGADPRSRLLEAGERAWLGHPAVRVVRLAGLYGPGRLIGEADLRRGSPLAGDPDRWLNLIHVEDAADLLLAVAAGEGAARIELGSDDRPLRRHEWYTSLASALGLPPPTFDRVTRAEGPRSASAASRRCDNRPTCRRTGWRPRHPDWRSGLAACSPRV